MTEQEKIEQFGILAGNCPCCQALEYDIDEVDEESMVPTEQIRITTDSES
ncbi:TPA: hypothetical protein OMP93_000133 [Acinetobacter baumannii]|nr:hypothetical protein [Acinetobacter baumannii]HCQ9568433.1 hypothetical protein [Acinetobacter baumannii]HEN9595747.1 hypothetical protein [Acinetobacter baumannii]